MLKYIRYSRPRRRIAILALLALLLQVFLPIFHHPATEIGQLSVHQCSVPNRDYAHYTPNKSLPQKLPSCPICQTLHLIGGNYIQPSEATYALFANAKYSYLHISSVRFVQSRLLTDSRPRAPPAYV